MEINRMQSSDIDITPGQIPERTLGRTGRSVTMLGLGGAGLLAATEDRKEAAEFINRAIDLGINYIDTAPTYGPSEDHIGEVLPYRRNEVFLATKVHERTRDAAWEKIETSLQRMKVGHIDLIQVHDIQTADEVDEVMDDDGAIQAIVEARDQGLVTWVGVTGHKDPYPMVHALQLFDFDAVLIPVNIADKHYLSYTDVILPMALESNMGIIGIKVFCSGGEFDDLQVSPEESLRYALSFPVSTVVLGMDNIRQLEENVRYVTRFQPMSEEEMNAITDRTREHSQACSAKFKRHPG